MFSAEWGSRWVFVGVLEGLTPDLGLIQTPFRRHPMKDITIRRRLVEPPRSWNATDDLNAWERTFGLNLATRTI